LDVFGTWSTRSERPWQNVNVWDTTVCCNDKTNRFFVLMRALFGWQDQATPVEIIAYILYWVAATIIVSLMVWHAKKKMQKMVEKWRLEDEEALKKSREEPTTIGHQAEDEKAELCLVISAASKQDLEGAGKLLLGSIARGVGARFRAKQLWSRRCDGPIVGVGLVAGAALSRSFTARGGKKNLVFIATRGGESYDALVRLRDPRQGEAPRFVFHRQTVQSSRQ
ncbi:FTR1, partial [Symbiodinium microadriaticum]